MAATVTNPCAIHCKMDTAVIDNIVKSAFDYTIGRASYSVTLNSNVISSMSKKLSAAVRGYIDAGISAAFAEKRYGMEMDKDTWDLLQCHLRIYAKDSVENTTADAFNVVGIDDFWFFIGSAFRYDLRGFGGENKPRTSLDEYRKIIEDNVSLFNEKWRLNLMRDLVDGYGFGMEPELVELFNWLKDLKVNGEDMREHYENDKSDIYGDKAAFTRRDLHLDKDWKLILPGSNPASDIAY